MSQEAVEVFIRVFKRVLIDAVVSNVVSAGAEIVSLRGGGGGGGGGGASSMASTGTQAVAGGDERRSGTHSNIASPTIAAISRVCVPKLSAT